MYLFFTFDVDSMFVPVAMKRAPCLRVSGHGCLNFRFHHVDVQFVVYVWIVFGLAETKAGNVDILYKKKNTRNSQCAYMDELLE